MNRSQIQSLWGIGSRGANKRLKNLIDDGWVLRNEGAYVLSKKGCEFVGVPFIKRKVRGHEILRTKYLMDRGFDGVKMEQELIINDKSYGICDAVVGKKLIEVDYTQRWIENKKKLERYEQLFTIVSGFELIWVTAIESRVKKFKEEMKKRNIPGDAIYLDA